ncbi:SGNH hydrolase-type esterase domain-containing protein [Dactylonectria macrodidyma]|uniref:SGNH hydrolase-type esterase domain-containing protein n=1 Tax=Dactylonectria macrodidyma TaxID=307937 RepID=A0A9P9DDG3_9HYPO|nr:SGNH hydrolase-type esterase domain-containing protein [Dactylonectria macrodidyma]
MSLSILVGVLALSSFAHAYVPRPRTAGSSSFNGDSPSLAKRADDPSDFTWVKRWAAIGDSYTAGIGAGAPLGRALYEELSITLPNGTISGHGDWYCARYDRAYPMVIDRTFGSHVDDFQYIACSGDRTGQIYQQAQQLKGELDFVTLTAGGNDLCLAGIIQSCIMLPYWSTSACETVLAQAEENVENILKDNVKQVLTELNDKMNDAGIVVLNGYAQFFDTTTDDCEDEAWDAFSFLPLLYLAKEKLTVARRKRFNELVISINNALSEAAAEIAEDEDIKYTIGFADWDPWVYEATDGQMCSPSSNGEYPDENQPDMQFFKPNTLAWDDIGTELRKRELSEKEKRHLAHFEAHVESRRRVVDATIYDSALFKSADPRAIVRHVLNRRDPEPPGCPGDEKWDKTLGLGLPNAIGRNFHPNENGHVTIASFAIAEAMDLRAVVLGVDSPSCEEKDEFTCWSSEDSKGYAHADRLDNHYKEFCKGVEQPEHTLGWKSSKSYDVGTPDEHSFLVQLSDDVGDFNEDECLSSMKALIHNCDTTREMNWKSGGKYVRGDYTYEVNIKRDNRPWPPPSEPVGRCEGWYKVLFGSYEIEGGGFSTWDHGQKTMIPSMNGCYGLGTTGWKFEYYDEPTSEGYEWKATFHTPIWVRARCFKNNKVVKGAGGWTDGCKGND